MSSSTGARAANERIADRAQTLHFVAPVPFICECDDEDCQALLLIGLDAYRELRSGGGLPTSPGHHVDDADVGQHRSGYWVQHRRHRNGSSQI